MTEVLVKCPICENESWVEWGKKNNTICFNCFDVADSPPVMIPQIKPQSHEAVAVLYVTRNVKEVPEVEEEEYEENIIKPRFCPHCGNKLVDNHGWIQGYLDNNNHKKVQGYDCYCDSCAWTGNIEPDEFFEKSIIKKEIKGE